MGGPLKLLATGRVCLRRRWLRAWRHIDAFEMWRVSGFGKGGILLLVPSKKPMEQLLASFATSETLEA